MIILLLFLIIVHASSFIIQQKWNHFNKLIKMCNPSEETIDESLIVSKEINRFEKKLIEVQNEIDKVRQSRKEEEEILDKLEKEFGSEIARIKKEFARIKERSYEESMELSNKAKVDALKEVLPITDNYYRAKKVFEPIDSNSGEGVIYDTYDKIFASFTKVIEDFGVTRVVSVGQPFDYNFMEAIMQQPSTEYPANTVSVEYQVGYKMGEKCIRPAMVVVSLGPGPSK